MKIKVTFNDFYKVAEGLRAFSGNDSFVVYSQNGDMMKMAVVQGNIVWYTEFDKNAVDQQILDSMVKYGRKVLDIE